MCLYCILKTYKYFELKILVQKQWILKASVVLSYIRAWAMKKMLGISPQNELTIGV